MVEARMHIIDKVQKLKVNHIKLVWDLFIFLFLNERGRVAALGFLEPIWLKLQR